MPKTPTDFLDEARRSVPEVTALETKAGLDSGKVKLVLDVREPAEFEAGHIPGAMNVPRGLLEWNADKLHVDREAEVVVQCAAGGRSLLAARVLQEMGYSKVSSMKGGITDWGNQGLPVEK